MNVDTTVTDIYKEYLRQIRLLEFELVYPIVTYNATPKLSKYVRLLINAPCTESSYQTLYGDIKTVVSSYVCFHNDYIDEITRKFKDYSEMCTKENFVELVNSTLEIHKMKQLDFARDYLPVKSEYEKNCYENIESMFGTHQEKYENLLKALETLNEESEDRAFMASSFETTLQREAAIVKFTHRYLSFILMSRINDIDLSITHIWQRLSHNLKELQKNTSGNVKGLLNALYEKNKEWITIHRNIYGASQLKNAEIVRTITNIRQKIKDCRNLALVKVEEETHFWTKKLQKINKINCMLQLLQNEFKSMETQEEILVENGVTEEDETYAQTLGKVLTRKRFLSKRIEDIGMAIFSFFEVKGPNEIWFKDETGHSFYIDEYGHQVFRHDHGLNMLHLDCSGHYIEFPASDQYYYNDVGRFILDDEGERLYQLAPCTSLYKLDESRGDLHKIDVDCGHSEAWMGHCKKDIKNIFNKEEKEVPIVDIKESLEPDTVKYLMKTFGAILPRVLYDVATVMPKNPLYFIAHSLLKYKYRRPYAKQQRQQMKKDTATARRRSEVSSTRLSHDVKHYENIENLLICEIQMINEQNLYEQNGFDYIIL